MEYTAPVPGVATTTRVVSKRQCSPKGFNSSPEGRTTRFSPGTAGSKPAHAAFRAQASGLVCSDWSETATASPAELGTVRPVIRLDGPRLSG
jgi:hypothetical protein